MEHLKIPEGYSSPLTIRETEVAIKEVKDHFERALAKSLHLTRVSAPLFVLPQSGMNDNLNGIDVRYHSESKSRTMPARKSFIPSQNGSDMP